MGLLLPVSTFHICFAQLFFLMGLYKKRFITIAVICFITLLTLKCARTMKANDHK